MVNAVRINEIVHLLEIHDNKTLIDLRKKYPEQEELLRSGEICGDEEVGGTKDSDMMKIDLTIKGLSAVLSLCPIYISKVQKRLKSSNNITFIGTLMTTIGGASFFGTLATDFPRFASYTGASITLLGSLFPHIASHLRTGITQSDNLFDIYNILVEKRFDAEQMLNDLHTVDSENCGKVEEITLKSNTLCGDLNKLFAKLVV